MYGYIYECVTCKHPVPINAWPITLKSEATWTVSSYIVLFSPTPAWNLSLHSECGG